MKKLLFFLFIALLAGRAYAEDFTGLMKKHRAGLESWMLSGKIVLSSSTSLGLQLFVFSGKWLFISGNALMVSWLEEPAGEYKSDYKLMVPPFHKVQHNYEKLKENYSGNMIEYEEQSKSIYLKTTLSGFKSKIKIFPLENVVPYIHDKKDDWAEREVSGYSIPEVKIEARIENISDSVLSGRGYFEHFWSEKMEEDHDWILLKLNSGETVKVVYRHLQNDWQKEMPGSFIDFFRADGRGEKIKNFKLSYSQWWKSEKTKRRYPLRTTIEIPEKEIKIIIDALKENQEASSMGMNLWIGFGEVTAKINGKSVSGWSVMMPMGYKEK